MCLPLAIIHATQLLTPDKVLDRDESEIKSSICHCLRPNFLSKLALLGVAVRLTWLKINIGLNLISFVGYFMNIYVKMYLFLYKSIIVETISRPLYCISKNSTIVGLIRTRRYDILYHLRQPSGSQGKRGVEFRHIMRNKERNLQGKI